MTKIEASGTADSHKPGMSFFAELWPFGETCGNCRASRLHRRRKAWPVAHVQKLTGAGEVIDGWYLACKYFEGKPSRRRSSPGA